MDYFLTSPPSLFGDKFPLPSFLRKNISLVGVQAANTQSSAALQRQTVVKPLTDAGDNDNDNDDVKERKRQR